MEMTFRLNEKEIRERIPFGPLAESVNMLGTGKARRLMEQLGISRDKLEHYQEIARQWYLITGCPDDKSFTRQELEDWDKIGQLVCSL